MRTIDRPSGRVPIGGEVDGRARPSGRVPMGGEVDGRARPSGRVPIGGEVDGRATPMLADKGAGIGASASGRAEGWMEEVSHSQI